MKGLLFILIPIFLMGIVSSVLIQTPDAPIVKKEELAGANATYNNNITQNFFSQFYNVTMGVNATQMENATLISIKENWLDTLFTRTSVLDILFALFSANDTRLDNRITSVNSTFNIGNLYNGTALIFSQMNNNTATLQQLLNSTGIYSTYNKTYADYIDANETSRINLLNQTITNSNASWLSTFNTTYNNYASNVSRNWSSDTFTWMNTTWDNNWVNAFAYNHSLLSTLQTILNWTGIYDNNNATYISQINVLNDTITNSNASWLSTYNSTYAGYTDSNDTARVNLLNQTMIDSNASWLSTYNSTYNNYALNVSLNHTNIVFTIFNTTWDNSFMNIWNYNQTTATYNLYSENWYNHTLAVYNLWNDLWTTTFNSTYNSQIGVLNNTITNSNASWLSTFNATYNAYALNVSTNYTQIVFDIYNNTWDNSWANSYNITWVNHTKLVADTYNSTWDNNWVNQFAYNQSLLSVLQNILNWTGLYDKDNSTYVSQINILNDTITNSNASWLSTYNSTYAGYTDSNDTLRVNLLNQTMIDSNASWLSTYNETYNSFITNVSKNWTLDAINGLTSNFTAINTTASLVYGINTTFNIGNLYNASALIFARMGNSTQTIGQLYNATSLKFAQMGNSTKTIGQLYNITSSQIFNTTFLQNFTTANIGAFYNATSLIFAQMNNNTNTLQILLNSTGIYSMPLSINTTANIQNLLNSTGIYDTYNATYASYVDTNESYRVNLLNSTITDSNLSWLSTFNATYNNYAYNVSKNWTLDAINGLTANFTAINTTAKLVYTINTTANIQNLLNSTGIYNQAGAGGGLPIFINDSFQIYNNLSYPSFINLSGILYVNKSSRNVGIGTTNPNQALEVEGTGTTALLLNASAGSAYAIIDRGNNQTEDAYTWYKTRNGINDAQWLTGMGTNGGTAGNESYRIVEDTGGTWTTRFNIQKGGFVGINRLNPSYDLDVNGSARLEIFNATGGSQGLWITTKGSTSYNADPMIKFYRSSTVNGEINYDGSTGDMLFVNNYRSVAGDLIFRVQNDTEAMRITGEGLVGIGTSSPAVKLSIEGNSDTSDYDVRLIINDTDTSAGSRIPSISFQGDTIGEIARIQAIDTLGLEFKNGSDATTIMTISDNGNVGIGTTNPAYLLEVADVGKALNVSNVLYVNGTGANVGIGTRSPSPSAKLDIGTSASVPIALMVDRESGQPSIRARNSSSGGSLIIESNGTGGGLYLNNYGSDNVLLAIGGGNVGIGITDTSRKLEVDGIIKWYTPDDLGFGELQYITTDTPDSIAIVAGRTGEGTYPELNFWTGGSQRLTINNIGDVGIGTLIPSRLFEVNGISNLSGNNFFGKASATTNITGELWINGINNTAPDYVFEKEYTPKTLAELKTYVETEKHLPDIASAEEIAIVGMNIQQTNNGIIKNIEEMLLHLFGLDERMTKLEQENADMKKALCEIKPELELCKLK